jgi:hypothetical protein
LISQSTRRENGIATLGANAAVTGYASMESMFVAGSKPSTGRTPFEMRMPKLFGGCSRMLPNDIGRCVLGVFFKKEVDLFLPFVGARGLLPLAQGPG